MKKKEPAHRFCYGSSSKIHIRSEKSKVQSILCGVLLPESEAGSDESHTCSCVQGTSGERTGRLGRRGEEKICC